MEVKITLDMLTDKSVSVKTQKYITDGGVEYAVGLPHRRAFVNSERGRAEIAEALQEPYLSAVMAVWGESATVVEENPLGGE